LGLAPEDLLLALCAHGAKHFWARLGWICDVSELIGAQNDIVWPRVLTRARMLGSERMLLLGLFLARDLLGAQPPEAVFHEAQSDARVRSLAAQVKAWLPLEEDPPTGALPSMRFHLAVRERLHDRIRYCLEGGLRPSYADWQFLPLPDPLFSLYYLIRPIRIMWQGLGRAQRRGPKILP
jgi:hypothetical protein